MPLPTYADVVDALPVVSRWLRPTPLIEWPALSALLGCRYLLKHENHLPTTAFKVRGGINLVARLDASERAAGVLGCTTGNHGSANEPHLIAGVGTCALEIFDELPEPDIILVPVGLGSGICGTALVAAERRPATRVIGVQSELASAVAQSWREGRWIEGPLPQTFAEGFATRVPAEMTLEIMRRLVHDIVLVSDDQLRESIRLLLRTTHNLAEGAGAASTAAALYPLREQLRGKKVVGVLSGGNLDLRELGKILEVKSEK